MKRIFTSIRTKGRAMGIVVALFASLFALSFAFSRGQSNQRASLTPAVQAQEAERAPAARTGIYPRTGRCSPGDVAGKYGILIQGTVLPPNAPVATPAVAAGLVEVDFAGNLTGADTLSLGGQIIPRTYSGTLNVKFDCTFTSRFTYLTGLPGVVVNSSGVVVDGANEIYFVETDPNTIFTAVAKRM